MKNLVITLVSALFLGMSLMSCENKDSYYERKYSNYERNSATVNFPKLDWETVLMMSTECLELTDFQQRLNIYIENDTLRDIDGRMNVGYVYVLPSMEQDIDTISNRKFVVSFEYRSPDGDKYDIGALTQRINSNGMIETSIIPNETYYPDANTYSSTQKKHTPKDITEYQYGKVMPKSIR